jgi:ATP-binding cassette subfamily F protein uup
MPLLSLEEVTFGHSRPPLLENVTLRIERGERIALLGRNGAGKSTLLKLLAGEIVPDAGEVRWQAGVRVARLVQEVPSGHGGTVAEIVLAGAGDLVDHDARWRAEQQAERVMARMTLDPAAPFDSLSSGMKRRVLLARTLVAEPEVLLLDEPTNHLDVESITWLEGFLSRFAGTFLFVTHDRAFMRRLANRVIELERGRLFDWTCDYDTFLRRKDEALEAEAR